MKLKLIQYSDIQRIRKPARDGRFMLLGSKQVQNIVIV